MGYRVSQKRLGNFKNITTIFCTLLHFWKFHYVNLEAILKRLQGSFEEEFRELKYGSPAVANPQSLKLNISWFPKYVEMSISSYLKISYTFHFQDANNLTKPKSEQKWYLQEGFFKGLLVINIYFSGRFLFLLLMEINQAYWVDSSAPYLKVKFVVVVFGRNFHCQRLFVDL